ncbi:MAG: DUF3987 domain-containing protein [Bacteroidota bacterium]|nr:DUF3987 domain-containing protein [Bacteroidota bacterium]
MNIYEIQFISGKNINQPDKIEYSTLEDLFNGMSEGGFLDKDIETPTIELGVANDEKEKSAVKQKLPWYCVAIRNATYRSYDHILELNPLLQIDMDKKENLDLLTHENKQLLKDKLMSLPYVVSVIETGSGGFHCIIYCKFTIENFKDVYEQLYEQILKETGLKIDMKAAKLSQAFYAHHDANFLVNENPKYFEYTQKVPKVQQTSMPVTSNVNLDSYSFKNEFTKVESSIVMLESENIDITISYKQWIKICFALVNTFGEFGLELFHRVSKLSFKYDEGECEKQYLACSKAKKDLTTIGTYHWITKLHGIYYSNKEEKYLYDPYKPFVVEAREKALSENRWLKVHIPEVGYIDYNSLNSVGNTGLKQPISDESAGINTKQTEYKVTNDNSIPLNDDKGKNYESQAKENQVSEGDTTSTNQEEIKPENAKPDSKVIPFTPQVQPIQSHRMESETLSLSENSPLFPIEVFAKVPRWYRKLIDKKKGRVRDMCFLAGLVAVSTALNNLNIIMDRKKYYSNLYLFVIAPPASGKNVIGVANDLLSKIHKELKEGYERELDYYNSLTDEEKKTAEKPIRSLLICPANISSSGLCVILNASKNLIMIETESDTLAQILKIDYANFSDILRKVFGHEVVSYYRKTQDEYIEINDARLSVILSGTNSMLLNLIEDVENGLLTRFMFYNFIQQPEYLSPYTDYDSLGEDVNMIEELKLELLDIWNRTSKMEKLEFRFSREQKVSLEEYFCKLQRKAFEFGGHPMVGVSNRLQLIHARICMALSAFDNLVDGVNYCNETILDVSLHIMEVLFVHSATVLNSIVTQEKTPQNMSIPAMRIFDKLGIEFETKSFLEATRELGFSERTGYRYLKELEESGKIVKIDNGVYAKLEANRKSA